MIIDLDGIAIEVIRKKIKNMHLRIYPPDGLVKVSAPLRLSKQYIWQTLLSKSAWIHRQRELILSRTVINNPTFETGSNILFRGTSYLLIIKEHHGPNQIKIHEELMYFYTQPNTSVKQRAIYLDQWYKRQMHALLPDLFQYWEAKIGVKTTQWGIKKMKTRWGSCNTQAARIWLNLELIKKPNVCLEYVIVHELIHLLEPSHNKHFYGLMTQFMPQWQEYELLLKGHTVDKL